MATSRRGAFRASLSPFGGGKLNLDDAYRVAEPAEPPPAAPPPPPAATTPTKKARVTKRPIAKKPARRVTPVRAPVRVAKKPATRRPVAKRIPPPPISRGLAEADRRRLGSGRPQPRRRTPPRPRVGAQRRVAEYG